VDHAITTLGDPEIRELLRTDLFTQMRADSSSVILHELGLFQGRVRVDIAVVNGSLHGYEIKSDRDSLKRLRTQVAHYCKVLDFATLVVGPRHLCHALSCVPDWWGVALVERDTYGASIAVTRKPRENPARDPRALVQLLWRDAALSLLESRGAARGVRGKPRRDIWDRACEHFTIDEIASAVRQQLKFRSGSEAVQRSRPYCCGNSLTSPPRSSSQRSRIKRHPSTTS
jgi:hypothetical protein